MSSGLAGLDTVSYHSSSNQVKDVSLVQQMIYKDIRMCSLSIESLLWEIERRFSVSSRYRRWSSYRFGLRHSGCLTFS